MCGNNYRKSYRMAAKYLENVNIHYGDCLNVELTEKPKLILTDPPYATGKVQSRLGGERYADKESAEQISDKIETLCEKWFGVDTTLAVICDYRLAYPLVAKLTKFGLVLRGEIIWQFGLGAARKSWWPNKHNHILTFTETEVSGQFDPSAIPRTKRIAESKGYPPDKPLGSVWEYTFSNTHSERVKYPNQKPLALLEPIVKAHTFESDLVFDPFMGSGSTGVASIRNGRRFIGCDIKKEACQIATERIKKELSNCG